MTNADPKDYRKFRTVLKRVEETLDQSRRFWTRFLFHFTSVRNAAEILRSGRIASRAQISERYPEFEDSASPDVINRTNDRWKDFVRFYFRPRTPTLYHNESFRPTRSQQLHAQCPVPIYFLFDLLSIIRLPDSEFSRGTLAQPSTRTYKSAEQFAQMPFDFIYHDTWFQPEDKDEIIKARQAELIYPEQLNLEFLKLIYCRSQAEKETLRCLLSSQLWNEWKGRIRVATHQPVYFKKWLYIEQVTLGDDIVTMTINTPESPRDYGPFSITATLTDDITGQTRQVKITDAQISNVLLKYSGIKKYGIAGYRFRCEIDGSLAYLGSHQERDIPF